MAKKRFSQAIKGRTRNTKVLEISDADWDEVKVVLEGEVSLMDEKSSGGSSAPYPTSINRKKLSCGKRGDGLSCAFTVGHMKAGAYITDIESVVEGAFDASFDTDVKADYVTILHDKN